MEAGMRLPQALEPVKRIIRSEICAECARRPAGEAVDPSKPVSCEHDCGIFVHLPQLVRIAAVRDTMLSKHASAAPAPAPTDNKESPLDCYGSKAIDALAHAGIFHG